MPHTSGSFGDLSATRGRREFPWAGARSGGGELVSLRAADDGRRSAAPIAVERFLNPATVSMPDIDIDFCMRRRGEVIVGRHGEDGETNVAQMITSGRWRRKRRSRT